MPGFKSGGWKSRVESAARLAVLAVLVLFVWPAGGCDSASFAPPPPDEIQTAPERASEVPCSPSRVGRPVAASAGAKAIALVLARHDPDDAEIVKSAARTQAGYDKVKLDITMLEDQDLPAQQVGLVHEALAQSACLDSGAGRHGG